MSITRGVVQLIHNTTDLVPALNSCGDGIETNGKVKRPGMAPSVGDFPAQGRLVILIQVAELLEAGGALRDEGALFEKRQDVFWQALFLLKRRHARKELVAGDADERVLDFGLGRLADGGELLGRF